MNWGDGRLPERFWEKCIPEPNSGCWIWTGATVKHNRGCVGWLIEDGKRIRVNRMAFRAASGQLGRAKIRLICGVSECCNPAHMREDRKLTLAEMRTYKARWQQNAMRTDPVMRAKRAADAKKYYWQNVEKRRAAARTRAWKNKDTQREAQKRWKEKYPEKYKQKLRRSLLRRKYGMTLQSFDEMVNAQNGACAICMNPFKPNDNKSTHVDHCHRTGKVRGILCSGCNTGIGQFKENAEALRRAADYVLEHSRDEEKR